MNRQPGRVHATAIGFFLSIGIFLLADLDRPSPVGAEAPAKDAPLCVELLLDGDPFRVIVEYRDDGRVERTGHEGGTCAELGEKSRLEWSDYLGLIPLKRREYYPGRVRGTVPTWFWIEVLFHFEPTELNKAFDTLVAEGQVQLNMSYEYNMEGYQCDQSGENCERETKHRDDKIGAVEFKLSERKNVMIGNVDYEVWVVDWYLGRIVYSPLLRIPLQSYEYRTRLTETKLHLITEVVGIHGVNKAPASGRQ
jgi:hypothetical protein